MTKNSTLRFLNELDDAVEDILLTLHTKKDDFPNEAINWGDLHCAEAKWVVYSDGSEGPEVVIEGAAPGSPRLYKEVSDRLRDVFGDVVVTTEW